MTRPEDEGLCTRCASYPMAEDALFCSRCLSTLCQHAMAEQMPLRFGPFRRVEVVAWP